MKKQKVTSFLNLAQANGHLIGLMSKDGEPLQVLREAVQNGIEAGATRIEIHPEFLYARKTLEAGKRVDKLVIADNGCGMSPKELLTHMRGLGSSSKTVGVDNNFGCGLKFTALFGNPEGFEILSYQNGDGYMVRVVYDEEKKGFGLMALEDTYNGGSDECVPIPEDLHEEYQRDNGTVYIFHGQNAEANTFPLPGFTAQTMAQYLNRRYWTIPANVEIKVLIPPSLKEDKTDWMTEKKSTSLRISSHQWRTIHGVKYAMDKYAAASGTVTLAEGLMHWFTFGDQTVGDQMGPEARKANPDNVDGKAHGSFKTGTSEGVGHGFTGILYQGELYEFSKDHIRLSQCGIYSSEIRKRVVFVFEPFSGLLQPNAARSRLRYANEDRDVSWSLWASQFSAQLPQDIQDLINSSQTESAIDFEKAIHQRLAALMNGALKFPTKPFKGKPPTTGTKLAKPTDTTKRKPPLGSNPPRSVYPHVIYDDEPTAIRCGNYNEDTNTLTLYPKSPLFKDAINRTSEAFPNLLSDPQGDAIVTDAVKMVFGDELAQRVLLVGAKKKQMEYIGRDNYEKLTSPEALELSLFGQLTLDVRIKQFVGGRTHAKVVKSAT